MAAGASAFERAFAASKTCGGLHAVAIGEVS
jgi:hypothetical protein